MRVHAKAPSSAWFRVRAMQPTNGSVVIVGSDFERRCKSKSGNKVSTLEMTVTVIKTGR